MKLRATLLGTCLAAAAAAAPAGAQVSPSPADTAAPAAPAPVLVAPRPARVHRNPNVITTAEIEGQVVLDVYDLIARLRPQWYRGRASNQNFDIAQWPVIVFLDGNRMGDVRELHRLQAGSVRELRFIPAEDAVTRWGRDYSSGAIEVTSR